MVPNPFIERCSSDRDRAAHFLDGVKRTIRWMGEHEIPVPPGLIADCCELERHVMRMGTREERDHV